MKKIDEIITVENLKGFLKTLGYDWSGTYYHSFMKNNGLEDEPKMAENISELINDEFTFFTELYPTINKNGSKNGPTLYIKFDFDYLILFEEENRTDRKFPVSDPKNYTKKWIMYLTETCGRKYVTEILKKLDKVILDEISLNETENSKLKNKIKENNKNLKKKIKEIGKLTKDIQDKLQKIEDEELNK